MLEGHSYMRQVCILVVDDFEAWRHFVSLMIGKEADLYLAGEASDGLEAIQKAKALKPDLVLLDLGLPKLNGLVVARRIRRLSPCSKILFLSQESSPDVVREALKFGSGFVVKTDAAKELLHAVNAVILDRQFLSSRLADTLRDAKDVPLPYGTWRGSARPPSPSGYRQQNTQAKTRLAQAHPDKTGCYRRLGIGFRPHDENL
jgi:DNA-binding NarL/FixJ family response regulator